jgi:hypothetical protein
MYIRCGTKNTSSMPGVPFGPQGHETVPAVTGHNPPMILKKLVFPQALGPVTINELPGLTSTFSAV